MPACFFQPFPLQHFTGEAGAFAGLYGFPANPGQTCPSIDNSTAMHPLLIGERHGVAFFDARVSDDTVGKGDEKQKSCCAKNDDHAFFFPCDQSPTSPRFFAMAARFQGRLRRKAFLTGEIRKP